MIIALEALPATGKSTIAHYLVVHHGGYRVPEVNELYPTRPEPEPEYWYCERQIERGEVAQEDDGLAIFDGDPYQPAWFNWIYPHYGFLSWSKVVGFFQDHADAVVLPSFYTYLYIDADERYRREHGREMARGHTEEQFKRKYARYADMLGPQKAYFDAMAVEFPGYVLALGASNVEAVGASILDYQPIAPNAQDILSWMSSWLADHRPGDFR